MRTCPFLNDSGGNIATQQHHWPGPATTYENNVFGSRTFNQPYDSIESIGPANTGFLLNTPATSLINYAGEEICGVGAVAACYPSFFAPGLAYEPSAVPAHYVFSGFLAPASDAIKAFNLVANFDKGDHMLGTATIATTRGLVLDENASLYSGATLLTTFYSASDARPNVPTDGSDLAYLIQSRSSSLDLFNLSLPTTSLVNYAGENICGTSDGTS